jgi:hypothetical protein
MRRRTLLHVGLLTLCIMMGLGQSKPQSTVPPSQDQLSPTSGQVQENSEKIH